MELGFLTPMGLVYMFSQQDIERLYGNFKILETYKSRPYAHPGKWFDEYLMEKVK